jgi:uncharacterized tellurite resistance protein B-like protein
MFGFGKREIELTPYLALAIANVYMVAADGEMADEEAGQLYAMFGEDGEAIINDAIEYIKNNNNLEQFIADTNEMLNDEQKEVLIMNILDTLLADGHADENEKELFFAFSNAYGIEQSKLESFFDLISKKNNYSIFQ